MRAAMWGASGKDDNERQPGADESVVEMHAMGERNDGTGQDLEKNDEVDWLVEDPTTDDEKASVDSIEDVAATWRIARWYGGQAAVPRVRIFSSIKALSFSGFKTAFVC